ncbi:ABC-2 type transport system ATP-binding protein [Arthrobacter pigmenti]|uniref:ABC-2 type transport system ATP-binding protein n=1 Tax=Arthrobacter pigmenti TaxID=271432 RepID=A0A846RUH4_9MICC|nr:ABC transporter ATP-binding protein [Arthrobacter pigmenti]NJC22686.1 ABC-2 type transport system ATP-binding protein [Arthrobacter pigmenti]
MSSAISTNELTKRYRGKTALAGITFDVPAGSVMGVIGPNGAGKTTTMRLLLDLIRPTSGYARVLGQDPRVGGTALRSRIGYLPGELRLDGRATGKDLLTHYARLSGRVQAGTVEALAERLGFDPTRRIRTLSKGNRQKLGLIQAFMHRPDLLVLDEPTSGLDPLVQQEFLALVRDAKDEGQTVFLSSHVISEIQQAADFVIILKDGHIVNSRSVSALRSEAARKVRFVMQSDDLEGDRSRITYEAGLGNVRTLEEESGSRVVVEGTLESTPDQFIKALARLTIVDLVIEEPDLERAVLSFYENDLEGAASHAH